MFIILLLGFLFISSCNSDTNNNNSTTPISLGVIIPLTGNSALYGTEAYQGLLLAENEFEQQHGNIFTLHVEDHQGDTKQAVAAYHKLKELNTISGVITGMSPSSLAIAPLANQDQIVQMAVFSSTPKYTSPNDYTFRVTVRSEVEDKYLAQYIITSYQTVAILYVNNDMGLGHKNGFAGSFTSLGGTIVLEEGYDPESSDFRTPLLKIKEANPQVLFIAGDIKTTSYVVKQAREMGITIPLFATRAIQGEDLLSIAGEAAEGLTYTYSFDLNSSNQQLQHFAEMYHAMYGQDPTDFSAQGYEAGKLLFQSFYDCSGDTACVKEHLFQVKDYPTSFGPLSFDRNGDVEYAFIIKQVKNGGFVIVE